VSHIVECDTFLLEAENSEDCTELIKLNKADSTVAHSLCVLYVEFLLQFECVKETGLLLFLDFSGSFSFHAATVDTTAPCHVRSLQA